MYYRQFLFSIEKWDKCGGVLLAGYEMYRSIAMYKVMSKSKGKTVKKSKKLTDENGDVLLSKFRFLKL